MLVLPFLPFLPSQAPQGPRVQTSGRLHSFADKQQRIYCDARCSPPAGHAGQALLAASHELVALARGAGGNGDA